MIYVMFEFYLDIRTKAIWVSTQEKNRDSWLITTHKQYAELMYKLHNIKHEKAQVGVWWMGEC